MQNLDNETLRQRVDDGVKREKWTARVVFFVVNFLMFILFLLISIMMVSTADIPPELMSARNSPVLGPMIMLGVGWFVLLIFQGISLLMDIGVMDRSIRDRVLTREIGRQIYEQATGDYEKPKRNLEDEVDYTVSDDGELVPMDDEAERRQAGNQS